MPRLVLTLLTVLALAGCSASDPGATNTTPPVTTPAPAASPSATTPPAGVSLTSLGFTHAPAGLSLPVGATLTERTDAANNITAVLSAPSGLDVLAHLRATLPAAGFAITADEGNSLLFTDGTWDGAFTVSGALSALTLRTDR
ncbi:hypothetical protein [Tessaracoccus lacteus]|uniref:Uncharacterized protein n=1 Tax=Tessaracoccus lacteus TaxID=3041766 RepID=A0ABY8PVL8_9ACTN|nr:hypothetical protein [Tessaracoccus sp. T21]WGT46478.1 hypothetical protein QH948_10015 [Tessaracoccus sp. T21]